MRMTYLICAAAALLAMPVLGWAQSGGWDQLPASGAHDEGLGKPSIIKLSSNLSSHSEARRYLGKDLLYVGALRWDKHSGTVWVYKTNAVRNEPYRHFAIRVYMRQQAPGKVEMKLRTFCDVGSDPYLNITQDTCDRIRDEFAPKLLEQNRQNFITFIGGDNTTRTQLKEAGRAIHDDLAAMMGESGMAGEGHGKTIEASGDID